MREFERITVENGQAFIRDTGISVSEVVRSISSSEQLQNLAKEHPNLSPEDIQEALAYAVQDLQWLIMAFQNEAHV